MLLTTTDTLERPYEPLGLGLVQVVTTVKLTPERFAEGDFERGLRKLAEKAAGADAVIGVRATHLGTILVLLTGTAVRFRE